MTNIHLGLGSFSFPSPKPYIFKTPTPKESELLKVKDYVNYNYMSISDCQYVTLGFPEQLTIIFTHDYEIYISPYPRIAYFIDLPRFDDIRYSWSRLDDYLTSATYIDNDVNMSVKSYNKPYTLVKRRIFKHSFFSNVHLLIKTKGFVKISSKRYL